jgi:hypothetical protein
MHVARKLGRSSVPTTVRSWKGNVLFSRLMSIRSEALMQLEDKYNAHNYHPIPVVLSKAEGG